MCLVRLGILMIIVVMKTHSQSLDSISEDAKIRLKEILPGFSVYGFNLHGMSATENILLASKTAIMVKYSDDLNYLITVYDFDADGAVMARLRDAVENVKVIIVRHSLQDQTSVGNYHRVPLWINNFRNLECLILNDVDLQSESMLEGLQLKLLWIQSAKVDDARKLIQKIGKIGTLEFLMYDSIFSAENIHELKAKLPQLTAFQVNH